MRAAFGKGGGGRHHERLDSRKSRRQRGDMDDERLARLDAEVFALRRAFVTFARRDIPNAKDTEQQMRDLAEAHASPPPVEAEKQELQRLAEALLRLSEELSAAIGLEEELRRQGRVPPGA